jgi:hypothetical protein
MAICLNPDCKTPFCPGCTTAAKPPASCGECGGPMVTLDHGITHHVDPEGEIDYDLDADHVAYRDDYIDGPLADDAEDDER